MAAVQIVQNFLNILLMSFQARNKSALTNDVQICVITLAPDNTSVALLLWLQLYLCAVMM